MEEKILWYKEVLALEPNSKLFFPLAVLLANNDYCDEALATLREGLNRHDEYLEARLFYIELLYKKGDMEEIAVQIEKLKNMFSHYTGFWQAWAAFLATTKGEFDTASILRFLALYFTHGSITLHEVIEKGLEAIMQERLESHDEAASAAHVSPAPKAEEQSLQVNAEPVAQEPSLEVHTEPVADEPSLQVSTEPVVEEPSVQMIDKPLVEEPSLQASPEPLVEEPSLQVSPEPLVDEPSLQVNPEPLVEEPSLQVTDEPVLEEPSLQDPTEAVADEPSLQTSVEPLEDESSLEMSAEPSLQMLEEELIPEVSAQEEDLDQAQPLIHSEIASDAQEEQPAHLEVSAAENRAVLSELDDVLNTLEMGHEESDDVEHHAVSQTDVAPAQADPDPDATPNLSGLMDHASDDGVLSSAEEAFFEEAKEKDLPTHVLTEEIGAEANESAQSIAELDALLDEGAQEGAIAPDEILSSPKNEAREAAFTFPREDDRLQDEPSVRNDADATIPFNTHETSDLTPLSENEEYFDQRSSGPAIFEQIEESLQALHPEEAPHALEKAPEAEESSLFRAQSKATAHPSLRTRSMAEILAEQGDLEGALEIYREIKEHCINEEESHELQQKIQFLENQLATQQPQPHPAEESGDKDENVRVLNLLEALSERLEARAQL